MLRLPRRSHDLDPSTASVWRSRPMGMDNSFVAHRASGRHRRDRCSYLGHAFCHGQSDYQGKGDSHECYLPVSVSGVLFFVFVFVHGSRRLGNFVRGQHTCANQYSTFGDAKICSVSVCSSCTRTRGTVFNQCFNVLRGEDIYYRLGFLKRGGVQ